MKLNNFGIKNTLHFYLDSFMIAGTYWEKSIVPYRPRFGLLTLQGYFFIMFEILWHHLCLFTSCFLTYWVSFWWFSGRVFMGSAQGLSYTERSSVPGSPGDWPRTLSGVFLNLSALICLVACRPTLGFARTREFNETIMHVQRSAWCPPHSPCLLPCRF